MLIRLTKQLYFVQVCIILMVRNTDFTDDGFRIFTMKENFFYGFWNAWYVFLLWQIKSCLLLWQLSLLVVV